jgi:hypothetical protein
MGGLAVLAAKLSEHGGRIFIVAWIFEANARKGNSPKSRTLMRYSRIDRFMKKSE